MTHLDRAIARLLDERARLSSQIAKGGSAAAAYEPFVDDLLRRAEGDFPAAELRAVFDSIEAGCKRAAGDAS